MYDILAASVLHLPPRLQTCSSRKRRTQPPCQLLTCSTASAAAVSVRRPSARMTSKAAVREMARKVNVTSIDDDDLAPGARSGDIGDGNRCEETEQEELGTQYQGVKPLGTQYQRFTGSDKVRRGASASAAFEVVDQSIVPPLPGSTDEDEYSDIKRARIDPSPDAGIRETQGQEINAQENIALPGADGRWNLAAATFATFPVRFAKLSEARKSVRRGEVRVSGGVRRGDYRPLPGEPIEILQRTTSGKTLNRADLPPDLPPLLVAYEDAHMAVVVKPEGVPTVGDASWTAERMLPYYLTPSKGVEGVLNRPRPAHRLDLATSGLLCVAKTRRAMTALCTAFERREVRKRYRAILSGERVVKRAINNLDSCGVVSDLSSQAACAIGVGGVIDTPLDGRPSVTHWSTARPFEEGDNKYGKSDKRGLFLCAVEVMLPPSATPWRFQKNGNNAGSTKSECALSANKKALENDMEICNSVVDEGEDEQVLGSADSANDEKTGWLKVSIELPEKYLKCLALIDDGKHPS